jgi:hypothetical protein
LISCVQINSASSGICQQSFFHIFPFFSIPTYPDWSS